MLAFVVGGLAILVAYRIVGRAAARARWSRGFRLGQLVSASLLALSHGTNDAQKTMGIIFLALVANGSVAPDADVPTWVVVSAATAIALGTYAGGWRIIRTMGSRIIKMDPAQGFAAQGVGATVIMAASHVGFPLSTTHVISGAIMGTGAAKRVSAVRWGVAGNIVTAWVLTLPAAAAVGGLTYGVVWVLGVEGVGPIAVSAVLLAALARRRWAAPGGRPDADGGGLSDRLRRRRASAPPGRLGLAARGRRDQRAVLARDPTAARRRGDARRAGRGAAPPPTSRSPSSRSRCSPAAWCSASQTMIEK